MTPEEENIHLKTRNFELTDQVRDLELRLANITRERDEAVQSASKQAKDIDALTRQRDEYKDSFETQMRKRQEDYQNRLTKWQKGQAAPEPPEKPEKPEKK